VQVLQRGEVLVELRGLRDNAYQPPGLGMLGAGGSSAHAYLAGVHPYDPCQGPQRARLARSVGAYQPAHLTGSDLQAQALKCGHHTVALVDVPYAYPHLALKFSRHRILPGRLAARPACR
jgi:hypothetical protein